MDALPPTTAGAEDTLTIDRKGTRTARVEVITRGERRRVWTDEQKREIVAESLGSALTAAEVARKWGISSGLLYGWRQKLLGRGTTVVTRASSASFARVEVPTAAADTETPPSTPSISALSATCPAPPPRVGLIEIGLPGGITLRVDATVSEPALRRVLAALGTR